MDIQSCGGNLFLSYLFFVTGQPGFQGEKGDVGVPGLDGLPGITGSKGEPGPLGPPGTSGIDGTAGRKGEPGNERLIILYNCIIVEHYSIEKVLISVSYLLL